MNTITSFVSVQPVVIELASHFEQDNLTFSRNIKHMMLAARNQYDVWSEGVGLRGLLTASYKYWAARSREIFGSIAEESLSAKNHGEFVAVWARRIGELEVEYDRFAQKQMGLKTVLGATSALSSFYSMRVEVAQGSGVWKSYSKQDLVHYIAGVAPYTRDTRFDKEDAKQAADWHRVTLDVNALREMFFANEVGVRAWESVLNSQFTSPRRRALMSLSNTITTKEQNGEWDLAISNLPEGKRYNVTNGEVHHLLGALLKQLSYGLPFALIPMEKAMADKGDEIAREEMRAYVPNAVWGGEAVNEKGEAKTEQYRVWEIQMEELQAAHYALVTWADELEAALHASNQPLKAVHGDLSYLWVVSEGRDGKPVYVKVTDKLEADRIRHVTWTEKRDAQAAVRWDRMTSERLDAVDAVMSKSYINVDLPDAE